MLDLDGVVYVGDAGVPEAADAIAAARRAGQRIAFITNNASRPPAAVASRINRTGVPADVADVVTSAQAAARVLHERHGDGARVAVLGAAGLVEALEAVGLIPVGVDDDADALVTGYGPDVLWSGVMRAAVRIRDGLPWVASNTDRTIPTGFGVAPGHGVMVAMLAEFAGVDPVVAGKPARPLLEETVQRTAAARPLMVGDRLDTDIAGAVALDMPALLVMTGVTDLEILVAATAELRPTYLAADLRGLVEAHLAPEHSEQGWRAGDWTATVTGPRLEVTGSGSASDWWRSVAAAAWDHLDETGEVVDTSGVRTPEDSVRPGTIQS